MSPNFKAVSRPLSQKVTQCDPFPGEIPDSADFGGEIPHAFLQKSFTLSPQMTIINTMSSYLTFFENV
jgi:hypothetical protein